MAARYQRDREREVQNAIDELRDTEPELAEEIGELSWVEDGISRGGEFNAVRGLIRLAHAGYATQLLEESWVVEGRNHPALESLWYLAANNPRKLGQIMSHSTISDGINEREANIVATFYSVVDHPDLLDKLLDPEQVTVEERTITLPLSGEMGIAVIITQPMMDNTLDLLEQAIRSIEEFMGFPFPERQVIYLFHSNPRLADGVYDTHVALGPQTINLSGMWLLRLIAHETGHFYWRGFPRWTEEGGAVFLAAMVLDRLHDPLEIPPCHVRTIVELEELYSGNSFHRHICHYSLGERLFRDLYRNMDDTTFRLAFRRLYLQALFNFSDNDCDHANTMVCRVKEAFTTPIFVPQEMVVAIKKAIIRWHDGTDPFDISFLQDVPLEPDIDAIDGRIERAYLSYSPDGPPVSEITAEPNRSSAFYLRLEYSYRNSSNLESLPIEVALSFEDGFEIYREQRHLPLPAGNTRFTDFLGIPSPDSVGRYWVHAYLGDQKIAEATFETVPPGDPYSIRGMVTGPDGQPIEDIALVAIRGDEEFWVEAKLDGTFEVIASSGVFQLQVDMPIRRPDGGTHFVFAGWYDGKGGVTYNPAEAAEIVIDDEDVEGIDITLPADSYAKFWGYIGGPNHQKPDGRVALVVKQGEESFWIDTEPYATFIVGLPTGSYILEVMAQAGPEWHFVGWYDGKGGITTDPDRAFEVDVEGADDSELVILLPSNPQDLLCPSGQHRSTVTGQCG